MGSRLFQRATTTFAANCDWKRVLSKNYSCAHARLERAIGQRLELVLVLLFFPADVPWPPLCANAIFSIGQSGTASSPHVFCWVANSSLLSNLALWFAFVRDTAIRAPVTTNCISSGNYSLDPAVHCFNVSWPR